LKGVNSLLTIRRPDGGGLLERCGFFSVDPEHEAPVINRLSAEIRFLAKRPGTSFPHISSEQLHVIEPTEVYGLSISVSGVIF
jgi:hypothetical protein